MRGFLTLCDKMNPPVHAYVPAYNLHSDNRVHAKVLSGVLITRVEPLSASVGVAFALSTSLFFTDCDGIPYVLATNQRLRSIVPIIHCFCFYRQKSSSEKNINFFLSLFARVFFSPQSGFFEWGKQNCTKNCAGCSVTYELGLVSGKLSTWFQLTSRFVLLGKPSNFLDFPLSSLPESDGFALFDENVFVSALQNPNTRENIHEGEAAFHLPNATEWKVEEVSAFYPTPWHKSPLNTIKNKIPNKIFSFTLPRKKNPIRQKAPSSSPSSNLSMRRAHGRGWVRVPSCVCSIVV